MQTVGAVKSFQRPLPFKICSGAIAAVFAGGLADRYGNVRVIVVGTILYALGMLLMSVVDNPLMLTASTGLLIGAGVAGTSFGIILPVMARAAALSASG
jgi:MFS family permease